MHRALQMIVAGGLTLLVAGCSTPSAVDINGEDDAVNMPEGELVVGLGSPSGQGAKRRENTLSLGYSRGVGEFEQKISSSEYVDLNNERINGPALLENEAELAVGYLRFVRHLFVRENFEWYWGGGLGHSTFKLGTTEGKQKIGANNNVTGLHGVMGLAYYFLPMLGIEGTLGGYEFPSDDTSWLFDTRAQLVFTPVKRVRFFAGYRHWGYRYEPSSSASDVLIDFYGPTAGVTLRF